MQETAVLLHNIRSAHNVGSIFRSADAAGVSHIYLSGYTPRPTDRFGRVQGEIAKTALGAEKYIPWQYAKKPKSFLKRLRKDGWQLVGVEQDKHSVDLKTFCAKEKVLYIFGNEVLGISKSLRDGCDVLIEIPMRGAMVRQAHHPRHSKRGKESLNVAVTAGIILFNISNRA